MRVLLILLVLLSTFSVAQADQVVEWSDEFTGTTYYVYQYDDLPPGVDSDFFTSLTVTVVSNGKIEGIFLRFDLFAYHEDWCFPEIARFLVTDDKDEVHRFEIQIGQFDSNTILYETQVDDYGYVSESIFVILASDQPILTVLNLISQSQIRLLRDAKHIRIRLDGGKYQTNDVSIDPVATSAMITKFLELVDIVLPPHDANIF